MPLENVLHVAPNAIANYQNIYYPPTGGVTGAFSFVNFSNPVYFVCGMIGAVANTTAPETAKLCEQYLGPALRLLNFNNLPLPINPYLRPVAEPGQTHLHRPEARAGRRGARRCRPSRRRRCRPTPAPAMCRRRPVTGALDCPPCRRACTEHARSCRHAVARAVPGRADPGTAQHPAGSGAVRFRTCCFRRPPPAPPPGPLLPAEGTPPS